MHDNCLVVRRRVRKPTSPQLGARSYSFVYDTTLMMLRLLSLYPRWVAYSTTRRGS